MSKVIKVSDEVHASLKVLSSAFDVSIGEVISRLIQDSPPPVVLETVLEQLNMRFDGIEERLSSLSFSGNDPKADLREKFNEVAETVYERQQREQREQYEAQQYAIEHPEDMPQ